MNTVKSSTDTIINLGFIAIVMLLVSLFLLAIVALEGSLAPLSLFFIMAVFGSILIAVFSNNDECSIFYYFNYFFVERLC